MNISIQYQNVRIDQSIHSELKDIAKKSQSRVFIVANILLRYALNLINNNSDILNKIQEASKGDTFITKIFQHIDPYDVLREQEELEKIGEEVIKEYVPENPEEIQQENEKLIEEAIKETAEEDPEQIDELTKELTEELNEEVIPEDPEEIQQELEKIGKETDQELREQEPEKDKIAKVN